MSAIRPRTAALVAGGLTAVALLTMSGTAAAAAFLKGFADGHFAADDAANRTFWQDESVRAESNLMRFNLSWKGAAGSEPAEPADPADPSYSFGQLDRAIIDATARGQTVLLTVFDAPEFATGAKPPPGADPGTWKPNAEKLGLFAQAVATRYSGSYADPTLGVLPHVEFYEAWNEPNLSQYITPQSTNGKLFAPERFRDMVNAFYAGVQASTNPSTKVVLGGTAPYGDAIGKQRTRPLRFLREIFCLNGNEKGVKCPEKINFDILAHHPITLSGGPNTSAIHPDNAALPDFRNVVSTIRAAERENTVGGPNRHQAWATELWWETKPPDRRFGIPWNKHARWLAESLYSLWNQGAQAVVWLQIVDTPSQADGIGGYQTGMFTSEGEEKPSFTAFRFPLFADRTSKKKVNVWTISPQTGTLEIQERRSGGFRTIAKTAVKAGVPDQKKIKLSGKPDLRVQIAGDASLAFPVK